MTAYIFKEEDGSVLGVFESTQEINHEFLEDYVRKFILKQVKDINGAEEYLNKCNFYNLTYKHPLLVGLLNLFPACKKLGEFEDYKGYKSAWQKHMRSKEKFVSRMDRLDIDYLSQLVKDGILKPVINEFKEIVV